LLQSFRKLIDQNFNTLRLPKDYAALLYITPNHLNALCNDMLGIPAGEVIRNRVILEAKRLLVNLDLTVTAIADKLNFADNSYFTRFFKKYTGQTPEEFRKQTVHHDNR
jgi:AraC-like DNA-binding protein